MGTAHWQQRSLSTWKKRNSRRSRRRLPRIRRRWPTSTESCPKLFLEDIERKDLLKFCAFLRDEKEQAPRSCWNKFANVMTFLEGERHSWTCEEE